MAFCPNCGTQATGAFCPNCGASLGSTTAGGSAAGPGASYQTTPPPIGQTAGAGLTENVASALCYLAGLITGIIFLVIAPYNQNRTIRFHAFQSIFVHLAFIVVSIILPIVTHGFGFFLFPIIGIAGLILWIYLMYSAYNGKRVKLPVVGDIAEKQA